jgi:ACS family hexuronate transporter-like MFS transporter
VGAVITPLIMNALMTEATGTWRYPFRVIGAIGLGWILLWFWLVRRDDLKPSVGSVASQRAPAPLWRLILSRRMLVLFVTVACINTMWQILRAWLPKFLQEGRAWSESAALYYNSAWFLATDVGCLGAGAIAVMLAARGWSIHGARLLVFGACAALCALCVLIPLVPPGWALGALLLAIGAGALGVFPIYHAYTQDISGAHQGRITGIASVAAWIVPAWVQPIFGWLADRTGSFDAGLVAAGFLPLVAWLALVVGWPRKPPDSSS